MSQDGPFFYKDMFVKLSFGRIRSVMPSNFSKSLAIPVAIVFSHFYSSIVLLFICPRSHPKSKQHRSRRIRLKAAERSLVERATCCMPQVHPYHFVFSNLLFYVYYEAAEFSAAVQLGL